MKRFLVYLRKLKELSPKQKGYLIGFFILLVILMWAFLFAGFLTDGFSRSQIKNGETNQEIDVKSMILTETKDDEKFWEIYGETGSYKSTDKIALLNNVIGNFYKDSEVAMSFESSKGTYNEEKNQIILYENTYIVLKDGTSLKCDRLVWSGSDKDIIAEGNIRINKENELVAQGEKVIINSNYDHFTLKGHTTSKIFDKTGKQKKMGNIFQ